MGRGFCRTSEEKLSRNGHPGRLLLPGGPATVHISLFLEISSVIVFRVFLDYINEPREGKSL